MKNKNIVKIFLCLMLSLVVMCSGCTSSSSDSGSDEVVIQNTNLNDDESTTAKENEEPKEESKVIEEPKEEPKEEGLPDEYVAVFHETQSAKTINYKLGSSSYTEEADDGKKYLIVDLTIFNNGYDEISINPLYFDAVVDGVEYPHSIDSYHLENYIGTKDIRSGGKVSGQLAFEIPDDSSSKYAIEYSPITFDRLNILYNPENVDIAKTQKAISSTNTNEEDEKSTSTSSNDESSESVAVTFSGTQMNSFKYSLGDYESVREADSGKTFLITAIVIENKGYDEVSVNPFYFKAIVDGVGYTYSPASHSLENSLESVDLRNGGKTSGLLAFEIPDDSSSNFEIEYDPITFDKLNIKYSSIAWEDIENK
ncbi:DUF4352 domain-containing protein [Methanococcus voltae]|uniref:DUF4352 domain-containing protein n=1 Tax=Methanococcus voltae TaxID=2188 RepID=A0A8J7RMJ1_METVO|nr:DUF4352 domain-containing protein [Methanococcus voltae]MBP2172472.1 hypothetical protein [Methanococcus voltae]MBP2201621.1 hypothetical protein [Methanococcus voltae]